MTPYLGTNTEPSRRRNWTSSHYRIEFFWCKDKSNFCFYFPTRDSVGKRSTTGGSDTSLPDTLARTCCQSIYHHQIILLYHRKNPSSIPLASKYDISGPWSTKFFSYPQWFYPKIWSVGSGMTIKSGNELSTFCPYSLVNNRLSKIAKGSFNRLVKWRISFSRITPLAKV